MEESVIASGCLSDNTTIIDVETTVLFLHLYLIFTPCCCLTVSQSQLNTSVYCVIAAVLLY